MRSGTAVEITASDCADIAGDVERGDRKAVVAVAKQDILAADQIRIAADRHLAVAVQRIFDIARDIGGQVAENGDGAAIAGHKESAVGAARDAQGLGVERCQGDQSRRIGRCVGDFNSAAKTCWQAGRISGIIAVGTHCDIGERYDAGAAFLNLDGCGSAGAGSADTGYAVDAAI